MSHQNFVKDHYKCSLSLTVIETFLRVPFIKTRIPLKLDLKQIRRNY